MSRAKPDLFRWRLGGEGEELGQFFVGGFSAVLADFEGLGEFGLIAEVFAVPETQSLAIALGHASITGGEILPHLIGAALALLGRRSGEFFVAVGAAFEEL